MTAQLTDAELARVASHLADNGLLVEGALRSELIAGGRSNWTFKLFDAKSSWVLRRPPSGGLTPSSHDMGREFTVTSAFARTDVPVARPVSFCQDLELLGVPFTVSEFVSGRSVRTESDLARLDNAQVNAVTTSLIETLVQIHQTDYESAGLTAWARADDYAGRQLRRWSGQWEHVKSDHLADANRLRDRLEGLMPPQFNAGVVHGDYRIDNVILGTQDPTTIVAVVDWELSTLGDPVADVALTCVYRHPSFNPVIGLQAAWTSERLPPPDAIAQMYADRSGSDLPNWNFYLALSYYKLAVIAQGIDHRFRAGATKGDHYEDVAAAVPELFAAGLAVPTHHVPRPTGQWSGTKNEPALVHRETTS